MMHRIMVAADGSPGADRAVNEAAELAKATGATLSIVAIGEGLCAAELRQLTDACEDPGEFMEARCKKALVDAARRAKDCGVEKLETAVGWGEPADTLITMASQQKADTLVVGRRGRGRLTGLLLGSVSQKLVTLAPCKVLVVP